LQYRAEITELENLITSITLAKINLLSPVILDDIDVREITNEHLTNVSVADALAVSKVKIFQNNNLLYFLVKFPKPKVVCKKLMIYPVKHNNMIVNLDKHNTVADCGERILAISNIDIVVGTTFCLGEFSMGSTADDRRSRSLRHKIIIDAAANITGGNTHQNTAGTFLITFDDQISLNGTPYVNHHRVLKKTPAVHAMAKINITEHHHLLSLSFLHELSHRNLKGIGDLGGQITYGSVLSCGATTVLLLGCFAVGNDKTRSKLLAEILGKTEGGLNLKLGGVNPTTVNDLGPTPDARVTGNPAGEIGSGPCKR